MESEDLAVLQQLANRLATGDRPLYLLLFDEEGKVVPWHLVFALDHASA
jgi:hypothetical protein